MKILLAVSGGIDSMYMAERASELFPGASFGVAHCNFSLRGAESDGDETFVRRWAGMKGYPLHAVRFDTASEASRSGESIEMAARRLRYAWFGKLCDEFGYDAVAVAHNACDNAETFLLNLLRGTGTKGLSGMSADSRMGDLRILRPILGTGRAEIRQWMLDSGHIWREDSTNDDTAIRRNLLRSEVLPAFAKINPSWLKTLERDMEHLREAGQIADDYWDEAIEAGIVPPTGEAVLNISVLKKFTHRRYLLYRFLEPYGFPEATVDSVLHLLESGQTVSGKVFEAGGWRIVTSSGSLRVIRAGTPRCGSVSIEGPGVYVIGGNCLEISVGPVPQQLRQEGGTQIFDSAVLRFPFTVRPWEEGDWLRPLGMHGKKKLSDLFTDLKWDLGRKESALVLVPEGWEKGHAGALAGERIDSGLRVTDTTKEIIKITITPTV